MIAQLAKEFRSTATYFPVALILAIVLKPIGNRELAETIFFVFIAFAAALLFGLETDSGTWSILLAQPISRHRLWSMKMLVLGVELAILTVAFTARAGYKDYRATLLLALSVLATVPWLALLIRSGLMAATLVLILGISLPDAPDPVRVVCFIAGIIAGFQVFKRWQPGASVRLDIFWRPWSKVASVASGSAGRHPLTALIRKELALQAVTFVLAAVCCFQRFPAAGTPFVFLFLLGFPALACAVGLAGDRELKAINWQIALPASARRQWIVKLAVCVTVIFFGAVTIPIASLWLYGQWLHFYSPYMQMYSGGPDLHLRSVAHLLSLITLISIAVASQARSILRAIVITLSGFVTAEGFQVLLAREGLSGFLGRVRYSNPLWCNRYTISAVAITIVFWILVRSSRYFRYSETTRSGLLLLAEATSIGIMGFFYLSLMVAAPHGFVR